MATRVPLRTVEIMKALLGFQAQCYTDLHSVLFLHLIAEISIGKDVWVNQFGYNDH